jgi:hypothetical protein
MSPAVVAVALWLSIHPMEENMLHAAILYVFICLLPEWGVAQVTTTQNMKIEVRPVTKLVVSGDPGPFVIQHARGRASDMQVIDKSTSYSLLTNVDNTRIAVSIDRPMPEGTTLTIKLGSTLGASAGELDISAAVSPVDAVTHMRRGTDADQLIEYTFSIDRGIEHRVSEERIVRLTLTN